MPLISLVINLDSRAGFRNDTTEEGSMFNGCKSEDFFIDGVLNKQKFFEGYDTETIVYIDKHEDIPEHIVLKLQEIADTVVIRKHTEEKSFNDWNYIRALKMANGDYVAHFDQDCAAFRDSTSVIEDSLLVADRIPFVSYPSEHCPHPVEDESFQNKFWASTRYFLCRRERLNFPEIEKCLLDYDYWIKTYQPARACHWLEHIISSLHNFDVYYPPMDLDRYAIFCWDNYRKGLLKELNNMTYEQVKEFIIKNNGVHYPNNIRIQ